MPKALLFPLRHSLFIAGWLATGTFLHADTKPVAAPGYRLVPVQVGGKTGYIQVKDAENPYAHVQESDPNDKEPDHFSFNSTSPLANKSYDMGGDASADSHSSYQKTLEKTFVTKSYFANDAQNADKSTPGLHNVVPVHADEDYEHAAAGYDKTYLTASADVDQNKTSQYASTTSSYSGRTAMMGGHEVAKFSAPMSTKKYEGEEAEMVKRDLNQMNQGLTGLKDLPDRPLSIDEVRALINHGVKPNFDEKPPEASKPLDDPNYTPDPAPAPLREESPPDAAPVKDEDGVPAPGTMAHPSGPPPENSEALPQ